MDIYRYRILFKRLVLAFVVLVTLRVLFIFFNIDDFKNFNPIDIFSAIIHGFRFDISTVKNYPNLVML